MSWERPSARVAELIRAGIEGILSDDNPGFFEGIDAASLAEHDAAVAEDPALLASFRRANRAAIVHWAEANLRDPGSEVSPYSGPELQAVIRDLVRRGLDAQVLEPYRAGQNAAWQAWMEIAFTLTDDVEELRELLEVSARSIFAYVDATTAATVEHVLREREELIGGTSAERLETLTLILDDAPIDLRRAERRLGYAFDRTHVAAIIWSQRPSGDGERLDRVAAELARCFGSARALTAAASGSSLWAWVAVQQPPQLDRLDRPESLDRLDRLESLLEELAEVRVALGSAAEGIDGFRRSHAGAFAAQRLIARLGSAAKLARYDELKVVSLVTQDEQRAREFVTETLGDLETGPLVLGRTLHAYLRNGLNASATANALFAHRNTVVARIGRAEELLPGPLADNLLDIFVALEVVRWREQGDRES